MVASANERAAHHRCACRTSDEIYGHLRPFLGALLFAFIDFNQKQLASFFFPRFHSSFVRQQVHPAFFLLLLCLFCLFFFAIIGRNRIETSPAVVFGFDSFVCVCVSVCESFPKLPLVYTVTSAALPERGAITNTRTDADGQLPRPRSEFGFFWLFLFFFCRRFLWDFVRPALLLIFASPSGSSIYSAAVLTVTTMVL